MNQDEGKLHDCQWREVELLAKAETFTFACVFLFLEYFCQLLVFLRSSNVFYRIFCVLICFLF